MKVFNLIIKYKGKYICQKWQNRIDFISIPPYHSRSGFHNVDIFIPLLCHGFLNDLYEAKRGFNYVEGLEVFETFTPDFYYEMSDDLIFYDLDKDLFYNPSLKEIADFNLCNLPGNLCLYSYEELLRIDKLAKEREFNDDDEEPVFFNFDVTQVSEELLIFLKPYHEKRGDKDVLLLYSAGKDSTLAALRLHNVGYNVHFIHFDNGFMRDVDKPYLTFCKTFLGKEGFTFLSTNKAVSISIYFEIYFKHWKKLYGDNLEGANLDSEIRCLACRMAMYTEAILYAKKHGFKYIAEGARVSQSFMIEQLPMIEALKRLAGEYGISLLFPVLNLDDDEVLKEELLRNGLSAKSWESKCLLGRLPKEKTKEDEELILDYFDKHIKPKVLSKINTGLKIEDL